MSPKASPDYPGMLSAAQLLAKRRSEGKTAADIPKDYSMNPSEPVTTTTEWAVQTRTFLDGPFDRVDTGTMWSNRSGRQYTEEEARLEAGRRINGNYPEDWRRVVSREVTEWKAEQ